MNKLRDSGIYEKLARDSGSRSPLPDPVLLCVLCYSNQHSRNARTMARNTMCASACCILTLNLNKLAQIYINLCKDQLGAWKNNRVCATDGTLPCHFCQASTIVTMYIACIQTNRGGGKQQGLGPRNDVLTTCKAIC